MTEEKQVEEDITAPANAAGSGNIAGIGVGPQGEPDVSKKRKLIPFKRYINKNGRRA